MASKKGMLDPKAKAARQKKLAIGGGVLLLALLAFQVPRTMKMLHPKPPPTPTVASSTTATTTTATATTPAPTSSATGATATPAAATSPSGSADALVVNADLAPTPLDGQLTSFTHFTSKDPFQQQATAGSVGSSSSSASSGSSASKSTPKAPPAGATGGGAVTPGSGTTPAAPAPALQSAVLSINGVEEQVNVDADFPATAPLFHLVALTAKTAKISIAGGSLASGAPTVTLHLGKSVTLMNTADGTRYKIVLVSTSASAAATTAPAATSSTTTPSGG